MRDWRARLQPGDTVWVPKYDKHGRVVRIDPKRNGAVISLGLGQWDVAFEQIFPEKKPDPTGLNALIAEARVDRDRTVMVGDSAVDVQTARNAGTRSCGVRWGFQPETFVVSPPDFLIDDMRELMLLLKEAGYPRLPR